MTAPARPPTIVLLADRNGDELQPLTNDRPVALLPIATRSLLDLALEAAQALEPHRIDLILSRHSDQIQGHLSRNLAGSTTPAPLLSRGEETPAQVLQRAHRADADEYLVIRADMLLPVPLADFLRQARALQSDCVSATAEGVQAGLWYCRGAIGLAEVPAWPLPTTRPGDITVDLSTSACAPITSLAEYHHINLAAAAGQIPGITPPGRLVGDGLRLGRAAQCAVKPPPGTHVVVGRAARVFEGVEFSGHVVVGEQSIVDRNSMIEDSVILPCSYIGADLELRQAIVSGNTLIRIDSGAQLTVTDAFLLADLNQREVSDKLAAPLHRLIGLFLLLLSLPLWPLALLSALLSGPGAPLCRYELMGNPPGSLAPATKRLAFTCWRWNSRVPLLRELPRLLAVIGGRLRLLGTSPLTPLEAASREQSWQFLADERPAGLLGPTQLLLPADAPLEERLLSDAFFVRQRSLRNDLGQLLRACILLISPRSWLPRSKQ